MARFILSAQNFDIYQDDGQDPVARTGATSVELLDRAGAEGVILGHSESGDSLKVLRGKILTLAGKRSANPALLPYVTLLLGETWQEFNSHKVADVAQLMAKQLEFILESAPPELLQTLVLGYEPKWGSRGSGHEDVLPPAPDLISACAKAIKQSFAALSGLPAAEIKVIYGGRSTPERTEQILADENISGLILGSACNTVQKTMDIARAMEKAMGVKEKILHANFKAFNLSDSYESYVSALSSLDDSFSVYLSPTYTDIRALKEVLRDYGKKGID